MFPTHLTTEKDARSTPRDDDHSQAVKLNTPQRALETQLHTAEHLHRTNPAPKMLVEHAGTDTRTCGRTILAFSVYRHLSFPTLFSNIRAPVHITNFASSTTQRPTPDRQPHLQLIAEHYLLPPSPPYLSPPSWGTQLPLHPPASLIALQIVKLPER